MNEPVFRTTPQRTAILQTLDCPGRHLSAREIYDEVVKQFPSLSFATVYNTLQALKKRGMVLELTGDPKERRYDLAPADHHHLVCTGCHRIQDVHLKFNIPIPRNRLHGFHIENSHVQFSGKCRACFKERKGGKSDGSLQM